MHETRRASRRIGSALLATLALACTDKMDEDPSWPDAAARDAGVAALDAQVRPLDAALSSMPDASRAFVDAASAACSIDQHYRFYMSGGLVQTTVVSELKPDAAYGRTLTMRDSSTRSCASVLPACGSKEVDAGELRAALSASDVVSGFGDGSLVYGLDSRPVDGQLFVLERADQKQLVVGSDCQGQSGCRAIPKGVAALVTLLNKLSDEQAAMGPCQGLGA
jgi:hypothetical protein